MKSELIIEWRVWLKLGDLEIAAPCFSVTARLARHRSDSETGALPGGSVSSAIFFSQKITYGATVRRTIERFDKALKALGEEVLPPTPIMFEPR